MSRTGQVFLSSQRLWWRVPGKPVKEASPQGIQSALRAIGESAINDDIRDVTIWLGGDLCRLALASPVGGAKNREEAELAMTAALRARQIAKADEVVRIGADMPTTEAPVVLMNESLASECNAWRPPRGVHLQSVKPWWSAVAVSALAQASSATSSGATMLALFDGESLTLCAWDAAGKMTEAMTQIPATVEVARRMMTRRALDQAAHVVRCVSLIDAAGEVQPSPASGFAFSDRVVISDRF